MRRSWRQAGAMPIFIMRSPSWIDPIIVQAPEEALLRVLFTTITRGKGRYLVKMLMKMTKNKKFLFTGPF